MYSYYDRSRITFDGCLTDMWVSALIPDGCAALTYPACGITAINQLYLHLHADTVQTPIIDCSCACFSRQKLVTASMWRVQIPADDGSAFAALLNRILPSWIRRSVHEYLPSRVCSFFESGLLVLTQSRRPTLCRLCDI